VDVKCAENNIEHRLRQPSTPKTNGMVERVNGTSKNNTILKTKYQNNNERGNDQTKRIKNLTFQLSNPNSRLPFFSFF
jgi:transposase InsO family protein